jgi:hypothetical protein
VTVRRGLVRAAGCYFAGALGCEALGALVYVRVGKESWAFETGVVCEEALEMLGATLMLRALLAAAAPAPAATPAPGVPAAGTPEPPVLQLIADD